MKKHLLILVFITISNLVFGQISDEKIKEIIKQEVDAKRSKCIIVGIVGINGRKIISEGIISDENPVLPDSNTIYEIGSITKVFTSLLLAEMSLKNQLNLNDSISKFLPKNIKSPIKNGKEITLLSLSTHRSGLPRNAFNIDAKNMDNPFADYSQKQLYEYISTIELNQEINSKWKYSNIGYALLGDILSTIGHKSFDDLVEQNICEKLHMNSTQFSSKNKNIAMGHVQTGQVSNAWDFALAGGGGLRSNMNDMLTFAEANLGFTETDLFLAMKLTHKLQAKKDGNDTYTTMGWTLWNEDGKYLLFKDGGTGGFRTFLGIDTIHKIGVVVLSNSNNSITDIGWHLLDSTHKIEPYQYTWNLLDTLRNTYKINGIDPAIKLYFSLKNLNDSNFVFNENQLNELGNELRRNNKISDAIKIYEVNIKEYPKLWFLYENLGETYKRNHQKKLAIIYFEKALELEPENAHLKFMLKKLRE